MSLLDSHSSCKNTCWPAPLDVPCLANNHKHVELLGSREQPRETQQNRKKIPQKEKKNNGKGWGGGRWGGHCKAKKEKGKRVWESGEISEAYEETGCEEDVLPSAHKTKLLLEDSWEQMTSRNKKEKIILQDTKRAQSHVSNQKGFAVHSYFCADNWARNTLKGLDIVTGWVSRLGLRRDDAYQIQNG